MIDWTLILASTVAGTTIVTVGSLWFADRLLGRMADEILSDAAARGDRLPDDLYRLRRQDLLDRRQRYAQKIIAQIHHGFDSDAQHTAQVVSRIDHEIVALDAAQADPPEPRPLSEAEVAYAQGMQNVGSRR